MARKFSKEKDRAHATNHDGKKSKGTHWVSLLIDRNTAAYLEFSGIKCYSGCIKQNQR